MSIIFCRQFRLAGGDRWYFMIPRTAQKIFEACLQADHTWIIRLKFDGEGKPLEQAIADVLPFLPPSDSYTSTVWIQDGIRNVRIGVRVGGAGWEESACFSVQGDPLTRPVPGTEMATALVARLVQMGVYAQ